jgi:hypothetical protein
VRDINDLREALDAETADLAVHVPTERIRRRAHRLRVRQHTLIAAAAVLTVGALAVPTLVFAGGSGAGAGAGGQVPQASGCAPPPPDPGIQARPEYSLGPYADTGVILDAPEVNRRFDVLIGLIGVKQDPGFVIAFRDRRTGDVQEWDTTGLHRSPKGDISSKYDSDPTRRFYSQQLVLGPKTVLDMGIYTRSASKITVASEGRSTPAATARNTATGWTFFWVRRSAAPSRDGRLTLTAYDAAGRKVHSVTGGMMVGLNVQNPRDHWPTGDDPNSPASCPPR